MDGFRFPQNLPCGPNAGHRPAHFLSISPRTIRANNNWRQPNAAGTVSLFFSKPTLVRNMHHLGSVPMVSADRDRERNFRLGRKRLRSRNKGGVVLIVIRPQPVPVGRKPGRLPMELEKNICGK
jgi:hypothetical protein